MTQGMRGSARAVHVLLTWELGANQGHVTTLGAVARELLARGARVTFAPQRLDALRTLRPLPEGIGIVQAPVWPGLLISAGHRSSLGPASFGDILASLGLRDSGAVEFMLRAWDGLLAALVPDVVVTDYAPMAHLAARGRIPVLATGTGFALPPSQTATFPRLRPVEPLFDEARVLDALNLGLARVGRQGVNFLPEILAADLRLPSVFAAFDPYGALRREPLIPPILPRWSPSRVAGGEEVFVYFSDIVAQPERIYDALAALGKGVRLYMLHLPAPVAAALAAAGVAIEPQPVAVADIARRSNLVVSHGGLGLVSMTLAAGLPQLVLAPDLEKRLTGQAVERLGVGRRIDWREASSGLIVEAVEALRADTAIRQRARDVGDALAPLLSENSAARVAEGALHLAGHP